MYVTPWFQTIQSNDSPQLAAGTIEWGFQRERASTLVAGGVNTPAAKWLRLFVAWNLLLKRGTRSAEVFVAHKKAIMASKEAIYPRPLGKVRGVGLQDALTSTLSQRGRK